MKSIAGKRAVIFTNGVIRNTGFYLPFLKRNDVILCANGGTGAALELGLVPDMVIGDLDSLGQKELDFLAERDVFLNCYPPEKDYSDLELALVYALEHGAAEIVVLGGGGGRPDQFFANLMLLNLALQKDVPAVLVSEDGEVRLVNRGLEVKGEPGDTVSLLAVSAEVSGIETRGLKFPLFGESLFFSSTRGLSNVLNDTAAYIALEKGLLLVVHLRRS